MTDEKLRANEKIIREGGADVVDKLWENNINFIYEKVSQWHKDFQLPKNLSEKDSDNEKEEIASEFFLAINDAYEHYKSENENDFTTLLEECLKKHLKTRLSNEEIIRQGGEDVVEKLWENNQGFIILKARQWSRKNQLSCNEKKNLYNDFYQQGYLAVNDAKDHYKPETGNKFITLLSFYLKKYFHECLAEISGWTRHQYEEITKINKTRKDDDKISTVSFNTPLNTEDENSSGELGDTIADKDDQFAEWTNRNCEEEWLRKLSKKNPREAEIIRLHLHENKDVQQIAEITGLPDFRITKILSNGLRHMRQIEKNNQ